MNPSVPVVYLLHGEDDFEIFNFIKAVKDKLGMDALKVRIINTIGKKKQFGRKRIEGKKRDVKKAIVSLKKGDNIAEFSLS